MERVMKILCDSEELIISLYDPPFNIDLALL
jgi:hypothetical protein